MKFNNLLAVTVLCLFSLTGEAQITSGYFPSLPDTILMASQSGNIQFTSGGDGTGQSWNFSQFIGVSVDTVFFKDPVTSGYGTLFPSAEVFKQESTNEQSFSLSTFYDLQASGAYEVGHILPTPGVPINVFFDQPLTWIPFPSNVGTSFSDTAFITATIEGAVVNIPADSVRFERTVYRHDTISASGSLLLSSGYYPNVLRKTTSDIWNDSIYGYTSGSGWQLLEVDSREVIKYSWIEPSQPFSLAELQIENGQNRAFRARPFDPGPASYYLDITGNVSELNEGDIHPNFSVSVRNISNNLIASGYSTDSIRVSGAGNISGSLAEWATGGVATFDSVFFHNGGDIRVVAYGFECLPDTFYVHVIKRPNRLEFVNVPNSVNRTELVSPFEVHAYDQFLDNEGLVSVLNTEYQGVVSIGRKSGRGAISGTVTKPLVNGVATFDDISFKYADDYELVAYFINVEYPDTASITVIGENEGEWLPVAIDTLSQYVDRASWFGWLGGFQGFSSGPSRVPIWTEIGQHFDFDGSGRITEVAFHVSSYQNVGTDADSIKISIYDAGVNELVSVPSELNAPDRIYYVDSLAKHLLGTSYIREDSLQNVMTSELFNQRPLRLAFQPPVEVHGPFIVTVQFNYINGVNDTLILQQSIEGDGLGEKRNSRRVINNESGFGDGVWLPEYMALAFTQHDYDYMIEPIVEVDSFQVVPVSLPNGYLKDVRLRAFPNPTRGFLQVSGIPDKTDVILISDMMGKIIRSIALNEHTDNTLVDTAFLTPGIYSFTVRGSWGEVTQRFIRL